MKTRSATAQPPARPESRRIVDLCDYLAETVVQPMLEQSGAKWDRRFMSFFSFDNTCSPLEPTGTLRLTVPPLLAGQAGQLEYAVVRALAALNVRAGALQYQRHPVHHAVQAITIPILENPAAQPVSADVPARRHHDRELAPVKPGVFAPFRRSVGPKPRWA
jgi:hypothetical protein